VVINVNDAKKVLDQVQHCMDSHKRGQYLKFTQKTTCPMCRLQIVGIGSFEKDGKIIPPYNKCFTYCPFCGEWLFYKANKLFLITEKQIDALTNEQFLAYQNMGGARKNLVLSLKQSTGVDLTEVIKVVRNQAEAAKKEI
jgi:hypothetical protein